MVQIDLSMIYLICMYRYQYQIAKVINQKLIIKKGMHRPQQMHNILSIAKQKFPHIDLQLLNPQLSLSQNLQAIISQIGLPSSKLEVNHQINNMKIAVDKQELKIQTSLVNDENIDINNHRCGSKKYIYQQEEYSIVEQNVCEYREFGFEELGKGARGLEFQSCREIIQDIWMVEDMQDIGHDKNGDWFTN